MGFDSKKCGVSRTGRVSLTNESCDLSNEKGELGNKDAGVTNNDGGYDSIYIYRYINLNRMD